MDPTEALAPVRAKIDELIAILAEVGKSYPFRCSHALARIGETDFDDELIDPGFGLTLKDDRLAKIVAFIELPESDGIIDSLVERLGAPFRELCEAQAEAEGIPLDVIANDALFGIMKAMADDELEAMFRSAIPPPPPSPEPVRLRPKIGRNAHCPCGSGKKFKKCHGKDGGTYPPVEVQAPDVNADEPSREAPGTPGGDTRVVGLPSSVTTG